MSFLVVLLEKLDGPGLPGGLIIYQGHLFPKRTPMLGMFLPKGEGSGSRQESLSYCEFMAVLLPPMEDPGEKPVWSDIRAPGASSMFASKWICDAMDLFPFAYLVRLSGVSQTCSLNARCRASICRTRHLPDGQSGNQNSRSARELGHGLKQSRTSLRMRIASPRRTRSTRPCGRRRANASRRAVEPSSRCVGPL